MLQKEEKAENKPSLCVGWALRKFTFWEEMFIVWYKDAIERFLKRGERKKTGCFKTREDLNVFSKKMLPFHLGGRQWSPVGFCTNRTSRKSQGASRQWHKLWLTLPLLLPCKSAMCQLVLASAQCRHSLFPSCRGHPKYRPGQPTGWVGEGKLDRY